MSHGPTSGNLRSTGTGSKPHSAPNTRGGRSRKQNFQRQLPQQNKDSTASRPSVQHQLRTSSVINLCKTRILSPDEISVLEFGLNFCPSVKDFNKESVTDGCFRFIRRLKLREYFFGRETDTSEVDDHPPDPDRAPSQWRERNPDYYPDEVKNNTSEGLRWFIDHFLSGCKDSISRKSMQFKNNLSPSQRHALQGLSKDNSIVIKPSDKCGKVVVMDVEDYDEACLTTLGNTEHYSELPNDPNPMYKQEILAETEWLHGNNYINKFERSMLLEGSRTPAFYGLPKLHKSFSGFPALRPICSGSSCCSKRLSEFIDTFLKPLAQRLSSYVQDTTDFINKTRSKKFSGPVLVATMDVTSLYPNIDHSEGADACEHYLNSRRLKSIPSAVIKRLILLVLRVNTLCFGDRFFHQIKGTAMGTPMAVNYANCFMGRFEEEMLSKYEAQHGRRPALWLRFIDDVFVVWQGSSADFNHFLAFCDNFAASNNYRSNIRFTSSTPSKTANFLDTTVTVTPDGTLTTSLYSKPTASYQYLHRNSYHAKHVTNSLPKSQFMRIRRICASIHDYDVHANRFVQYFMKRNYHQKPLLTMMKEVREMNRETLLTYKKRDTTANNRIPLVLTYNHKLEGIGRAIRDTYELSLMKFPAVNPCSLNRPWLLSAELETSGTRLSGQDTTGQLTTCHKALPRNQAVHCWKTR